MYLAMRPLVISERITKRETDSFKRYLQDVDNIPMLTADEEFEIAVKAFKGNEKAREELVKGNLRFVISVSKQYANYGVRLEDLVNEGNYGMIEAAKRFDPHTGYKFISYAVWWVRRCIMEYLTKHSRTIRIPSNQAANITKLTDLVGAMEQKLGRKAVAHEIHDELGADFSKKELDFFINLEATNTLSLDKPFGNDDSEGDLKDTLSQNMFGNTDQLVTEEDSKSTTDALLSMIHKELDRAVMTMHYGLDGNPPMELVRVANELNLTRERVRQIREKALRTLRGRINRGEWQHLNHK